MNQLEPRYEITRKDRTKDKLLKIGAWSSPFVFSLVPAAIFFFFALLSSLPPETAVWLFLSVVSLIGGFVFGLAVSGGIMFYRSRWLTQVRERLAVDGIRAEEVDWFKNELTSAEKKALKDVEARNLLLADAFRDTLAARLTATRIQKSAKKELMLVQRQQNKLKYLKSESSSELQQRLKDDVEKLAQIKKEADEMRAEAETRLMMIETAARHGTNFAETELTLKKLSARTAQLPLALEAAKMEDDIRRELEQELEEKTER